MCIYLFIYFINENVEEPLGGAMLVCFFWGFFWNLIRMKTLQFKYLFGRIFFYLEDILFIVTETDFDICIFWFWYTFIISWYYNVT